MLCFDVCSPQPDFPEDLENLITLDELEEDSSGDNQGDLLLNT
jgi:hypothetical protein